MNILLRSTLFGCLLLGGAAFPLRAQNPGAGKAEPGLDISNDPCGNPMVESMIWQSITGKVSSVVDGRTILLVLPDGGHLLRVRLAGIRLSSVASTDKTAKNYLAELLKGKDVEVLVNPSKWPDTSKPPRQITGVALDNKHESGDSNVALSLLAKGLVMFAQPQPYTMSEHNACQYRRAEAKARSKKVGLWQKVG